MRLNDKLKDIPTVEKMGKVCWTYEGLMKATGVHKNTVCNWIRETRLGNLDLPFICRRKGCKCFFPVEEVLAWYGYDGQN